MGQDNKITKETETPESIYHCKEHGARVGESPCPEATIIGFIVKSEGTE
jgi:hypothetical protein